MADASVLKEFLVAIGFDVDKAGQQKFKKAIDEATVASVALGIEVAKAAEAVVKAVVKMASDLDQLYFTSRRVNSAAENIKAFAFGIQQLGGSAEGAQSALEGIASFMRSNPGGERFIQGLGVATRDAKGQLRDTEQIVEDLGKQFAAMPFYVAKVRAAILGIDEKTLIALIQGPGGQADRYRDFAARLGLGMDNGADAANRFAEKVRDLKAEFGLLYVAVGTQLLPVLQSVADWLSRLPVWATQFKGAGLPKEFSDVAAAGQDFWHAIVHVAQALAKDFGPEVGAMVKGGLRLLVDILKVVAALLNGIADVLTGKWAAAWKQAGKAVGGFVTTVKDLFKTLFSMIGGLWQGFTAPEAPGKSPGAAAAPAGTLGTPGTNPLGSSAGHAPILANRGGLDRIRAFFQANGFSSAQAQGIAAGIAAEGGSPDARNPLSTAYGLGQWLKKRQADFKRLMGHDIQGSSLGEQLKFMLWELNHTQAGAGASIRGQSSARGAMLAFLRNFERPGEGIWGDIRRGDRYLSSGSLDRKVVTFNQKTDITVNGASEPGSVGRVVAGRQDRVNGDLVRQMKTAVS